MGRSTGRRVILDCDPGHDDAVAILLAARYTELLGITTVSGNAPMELATRNALVIAELLGITAPVHAGADRPLAVEPSHAEFIHGETGLDGPALPEPSRAADGTDAPAFIAATLLAELPGSVWLVCTGPLTNVALVLQRDPALAERIAGISLMGGSTSFGSVTPVSEFNIWCDPHAARTVFESGVPLTMCGLNLTHQVLVDGDAIARMRAIGGPVPEFFAELLEFFVGRYAAVRSGDQRAPLHDPRAVLALTHPDLFEWDERNVQIETAGELTSGMTVVDYRDASLAGPANVRLPQSVDVDAVTGLIEDALRAAG